MITLLIIILVLALIGAFPGWSHSREWGPYPVSAIGIVLFVLLIWLLLGGRLPR